MKSCSIRSKNVPEDFSSTSSMSKYCLSAVPVRRQFRMIQLYTARMRSRSVLPETPISCRICSAI